MNQRVNAEIRKELDPVIDELEARGVSMTSTEGEIVGLGDVIEGVLSKFGINQERFKWFFNLKECDCEKRRKFLNGVLSWYSQTKKT